MQGWDRLNDKHPSSGSRLTVPPLYRTPAVPSQYTRCRSRAVVGSNHGRLVTPGTGTECRQNSAIAPISSHRKIGQAHLGQAAAQLTQWRKLRIGACHIPKRVVAEIKPSAIEPRP